VLILLDFSVAEEQRRELVEFAADLAGGLSTEMGTAVCLGVIMFDTATAYHPQLGDAEVQDNISLQRAILEANSSAAAWATGVRNTYEALQVSQAAFATRVTVTKVMVLLTSGLSSLPNETRLLAEELRSSQVEMFSVGLDALNIRSSERQAELSALASSKAFEYDARFNSSSTTPASQLRRLASPHSQVPVHDLAEALRPAIVEVLQRPFALQTRLVRDSTSDAVVLGLAVGLPLLALCVAVALGFALCRYRRDKSPQSSSFSKVMPVSEASEDPLVQNVTDSDESRALKMAMAHKDPRALRLAVSDILLAGYPPADLQKQVRKALSVAEELVADVEAALADAIDRLDLENFSELLEDAMFVGVSPSLIQKAEGLRLPTKQPS